MHLHWIRENPAYWDAPKAALFGPCVPFDLPQAPGCPLPGDWWCVRDEDAVLAYAALDVTWGDAEIVIAVHPGVRGRGIGSYVIDQLEVEARTRGIHYLCSRIPADHPEAGELAQWLRARRFSASEGRTWVRAVVPRHAIERGTAPAVRGHARGARGMSPR